MKITYMLKREDFYEINKRTLTKFYRDSSREKRLYIYPELNAVVTARPSRAVRKYLYTEFRVNGSVAKRLLVRLYAGVLLNSFGLLAARSLKLRTAADRNTLIYPCNKKFRAFDFQKNMVWVFGKDGFPGDGLANEIAFRSRNTADFIPGLEGYDENGYWEQIIDGRPVARTGERMKALSDRAYGIWCDYISAYTRQVPASRYATQLREAVSELKLRAVQMKKTADLQALDRLCSELLAVLQTEDTVPVSLSHGDLQPGNIWVENGTDRIVIIDWESCQERSTWYDRAVLYEQLRKNDGLLRYGKSRDLTHATVLLEDVIFRLQELITLPEDYGSKDLDEYVAMLQGGKSDV